MLRKVGVPMSIAVRCVVCLEAGFGGRHFEVHFMGDHPGWCVVEDYKGRVAEKHVGKRPDVRLVCLLLESNGVSILIYRIASSRSMNMCHEKLHALTKSQG
jgi:hypothetical protein